MSVGYLVPLSERMAVLRNSLATEGQEAVA